MRYENLSPRTILIFEIVGGLIAGSIFAFPIFILAQALAIPYVEWIMLLIYPFVAAVGVRLVGRRLLDRGRLWHAAVGAYVPLMVIALVAAPASFQPYALTITAIVILPPLFAALSFNRFSRPTDPVNPYDDEEVDLLQYHDEGWEDDL